MRKHPHGRGEELVAKPVMDNFIRNTPTGVGKTYNTKTGTPTIRKHPHGRGEDLLISLIVEGYQETPPRAWGRLSGFAEWTRKGWKHPHGRGEDKLSAGQRQRSLETPPRAWGRQRHKQAPAFQAGNTPTGVGKTAPRLRKCCTSQKHPHGRGEE